MSLGTFLAGQWQWIVGGLATLVTAGVALFWSKYLGRCLLIVAAIGWGVFSFTYHFPADTELNPRLPWTFLHAFRPWVFGLGLLVLFALTNIGVTLYRLRSGGGETDADGPLADLDAAWREILIHLGQARIDPAGQRLYLLLTHDEALAAAAIGAAGLQPFVQAPASPEAPIHCLATADALYLSCGGASSMGRPDADGPRRLEHLCRLIGELNPARPILRGIAVLVPYEWARGPDYVRRVSAIRDDLEIVRRTLKVRSPTLTVCCLGEDLPGFNDFTARFPAASRQLRSGFAVPASLGADASVLNRGMNWVTRWFQVWSLELMFAKIHEKDGNGRLLGLNVALRDDRDALARLMTSALTVHQASEPVLYRGCYFVACGPTAEHRAFAAGVFGGSGRLIANSDLTAWSREADRLDRHYRRVALALAVASIAIAGPIWILGIIGRLGRLGYGPIACAALVALVLAWPLVLIRRRPRAKAKTPARA